MPGAMRTRERKDGGGALSSLLTGMSRDGNSSHPAVAKVTFSPGLFPILIFFLQLV